MFKTSLEELKEATAIDEGGPSRQFLSDAWKQLHALFVYIILPQNLVIEEEVEEKKKTKKEEEEKKVKLFEDGESALIPIKDEQLEEKIHAYLSKKCKHKYEKDSPEIQAAYQNTVVRVKEYARAIGRLLVCMNYEINFALLPFAYLHIVCSYTHSSTHTQWLMASWLHFF